MFLFRGPIKQQKVFWLAFIAALSVSVLALWYVVNHS